MFFENSNKYITKDVKDLTNYYDRNYINTNYTKTNNLNDSINNLSNHYDKNYINTNYYDKNYINTNYINSQQLDSKNYITANNLNNRFNNLSDIYQTKGNYLKYFDDNKNIFDLESDYMIIRNKNKSDIMRLNDESIDINNKINLNNELNIGDKNNFFNIKKENDCLITRYYQITGNSISSRLISNNCVNSNNINSGVVTTTTSTANTNFDKSFYNSLKSKFNTLNISIYGKSSNAASYSLDMSKYNNNWNNNDNINQNPTEILNHMISNLSYNTICINFYIKEVINFLKNQSYISAGFVIFLFNVTCPVNSNFKVINSDNINNDSDNTPLLQSTTKIVNNKTKLFDDTIVDDQSNYLSLPSVVTKTIIDGDDMCIVGIKIEKFIQLKDYITFYLNNSDNICTINFYSISISSK